MCYLTISIVSIFIISFSILRRYKIKRSMFDKNVRIDGKVVIVTGANSGLGKETALDLAKRGGKIYMTCRNMEKGNLALEEIRRKSGSKEVYLLVLDLSSMKSITEFVETFQKLENHLDVLINNAAVLGIPKQLTNDGFEFNLSVNLMGPALLTIKLLDQLKNAKNGGRIIIVSSMIHRFVKFDKENLNGDKFHEGLYIYAHAKLMSILFFRELGKRVKNDKITVNFLHPGHSRTNILQNYNWFMRMCNQIIGKLFYRSPNEGAQTQIMLAVDPAMENVTGKYFENCRESLSSKESRNDNNAKWLFETTCQLIGLK